MSHLTGISEKILNSKMMSFIEPCFTEKSNLKMHEKTHKFNDYKTHFLKVSEYLKKIAADIDSNFTDQDKSE